MSTIANFFMYFKSRCCATTRLVTSVNHHQARDSRLAVADYVLTNFFTSKTIAPLQGKISESGPHEVRSFPASQGRGATPLRPSSAVAHLTPKSTSSQRTARHDDENSFRNHQ
ncbi:hypothetical protein IG631_15740 [Alternaria alternata]|nr:hypothetical protein IG631_15740 [Alternaria alternata]